ncbi:MAG: Na+/H+ antiporter NhaA [Syntrophus sp. (in: bacteria)]
MPSGKTYPLAKIFGRILSPFELFFRRTTAGGIVLIGTTILTLIIAHSQWGPVFHQFWEYPLGIGFGDGQLQMTIHHWINDGLMAIFFLLVGLELKREIMVGELSSLQDAILPVAGALGGMIAPALIYKVINGGGPAAAGWGIPMATDIAFAIGILALLGRKVPTNLAIFLTALAIADDLGAVIIIALFYTQQIQWYFLTIAGAVLGVLILFNQGGIRHPLPYAILGIVLWFTFLKSGVHATMAGVLLALTIPSRPAITPDQFNERMEELQKAFHAEVDDTESFDSPGSSYRMATVAKNMERAAVAVQSPQQRMEHNLSSWVTFVVIPLFALANAGVNFAGIQIGVMMRHPVTSGVFFGLVLGKFVGISSLSWFAVKFGWAKLPKGVLWRHILGVAWLGGIGFTMSLFIGQLAFTSQPALIEDSKIGVFLASFLSATIGMVWLYFSTSRTK